MASASQQPPDVELHGSETAKPRPLRIVKRCQTVTGCSPAGPLVGGGRGISASSDESGGSPPGGADRPLTMRKTRRTRGSVLDGNFEENTARQNPESPILNLIQRNSPWRAQQDDTDATPRASLKPGHNTRPSGPSPEEDSTRNVGDSSISNNQERPLSRSKNFLKAITGGNNSSSKVQNAMRRISSNVSKHTFLRRPQRAESLYTQDDSLKFSAISLSDIEGIADTGITSRVSSHAGTQEPSPLATLNSLYAPSLRSSFVLCPEINVTPELSIVDTRTCSIWVALEVTGVLRRADGHGEYGNGADRYPSHSSGRPSDLSQYGRLYSMRIDLFPGRDCMVSEIFGNLRELETLRAKETYLVLVKIRLSGPAPIGSNSDATATDELIADLESDLSNIGTPYLTVRVTYKHSGFPDQKSTSSSRGTGMSAISARVQSEATAVIQRTNLQSQWSPRTSRTMNRSANVNPLIKLIEAHFSTDKAREALHKLANDRIPIPPAKRFDNAHNPVDSSGETANLNFGSSLAARLDSMAAVPVNLASVSMDGATETPPGDVQTNAESDKDPARKIWTEIRRTSRREGHRNSSSNTVHTEDLDGSPRCSGTGAAVYDERNRIMQTALRNKRSLGTDSLRSMAPSVTSTDKKAADSSADFGLSMRGRWGWGGAWW